MGLFELGLSMFVCKTKVENEGWDGYIKSLDTATL